MNTYVVPIRIKNETGIKLRYIIQIIYLRMFNFYKNVLDILKTKTLSEIIIIHYFCIPTDYHHSTSSVYIIYQKNYNITIKID